MYKLSPPRARWIRVIFQQLLLHCVRLKFHLTYAAATRWHRLYWSFSSIKRYLRRTETLTEVCLDVDSHSQHFLIANLIWLISIDFIFPRELRFYYASPFNYFMHLLRYFIRLESTYSNIVSIIKTEMFSRKPSKVNFKF